ncbi:MAG: hypothetical protein K6F00_04230 [Lachnospiraceae bacterium]|nr:hypothetical protein [Lachnospiraceae bacterium]
MRRKRIGFTLLSFIICLFVLSVISVFPVKYRINVEKERLRYIAENESNHISFTITNVMERVHTLTVLVIDHEGDTAFFYDVADEIHTNVKSYLGVT